MGLRGTNQEFGRPYNRRIVLESIRLHAPTTRAAIAKRVGLTVQTVSTIIRELELQGYLLAQREAPKGRGYPASALTINPEGGFAVGIHLTPLWVEASLVNIAGGLIETRRRRLAVNSPDAVFADIAELVSELNALRPNGRMLGVGMAMPGPFDILSMSFVGPTTMQGWQEVPIRERLEEVTGLPSFIEVDHAAAALGERLYGAGRGFSDFYYLYFGIGLGGCMMHDGNALRGTWGNAGEIGHLPAVPDGDLCPCGNRGCLERYVSLEAHQRRAAEIGEDAWLAEIAPILRNAIITIENMFDPQTIIFGGVAPRPLMARLFETMAVLPNSVAARHDRSVARVLPSESGQDGVLRGAAALVVSSVLSPRFGQMFADDHPRSERDPLMHQTARARAQ